MSSHRRRWGFTNRFVRRDGGGAVAALALNVGQIAGVDADFDVLVAKRLAHNAVVARV